LLRGSSIGLFKGAQEMLIGSHRGGLQNGKRSSGKSRSERWGRE
jgi:hypothetical protein